MASKAARTEAQPFLNNNKQGARVIICLHAENLLKAYLFVHEKRLMKLGEDSKAMKAFCSMQVLSSFLLCFLYLQGALSLDYPSAIMAFEGWL